LTFPVIARAVGPAAAVGAGVAVGAAVGAGVVVGDVQPLIARAVEIATNIASIVIAFRDFIFVNLKCH
jgi:hypothetical protein